MTVFIERFVLPLFAGIVLALLLGNAMHLGLHQRIGLGITIVGLAYLISATVFKKTHPTASIPPAPTTPPRPTNEQPPDKKSTTPPKKEGAPQRPIEISFTYYLYALPIKVPPRTYLHILGLNKGLNEKFKQVQFWTPLNIPMPGSLITSDSEKLWPDLKTVEEESKKGNNFISIWRIHITNHGQDNVLDLLIPLKITYGLNPDSPSHESDIVISLLDRGQTFIFYIVNDCPVSAQILIPKFGRARLPGERVARRFELELEGDSGNLEMNRSLTNWTPNPCVEQRGSKVESSVKPVSGNACFPPNQKSEFTWTNQGKERCGFALLFWRLRGSLR